MSSWGRLALRCATLLVFVLIERGALAAPRVVSVTDSAEPAAEGSGVSAQLRSELLAVGFDVVERTTSEPLSDDRLAMVAAESGSIAAIAVRRSADALIAAVWLTDKKTGLGKVHEVRVNLGTGEPARVLALRAVEVLHASSLEPEQQPLARQTPDTGAPSEASGRTAETPPSEPSPAQRTALPPAPELPGDAADRPAASSRSVESPDRFGIALGVSALVGPGGLSGGPAPALTASLRVVSHWTAELHAVGPASATVEHELGSASTDQEIVVLRARYEPLDSSRWVPFIVAGAGAYHVGARGKASFPYEATSEHAFALALLAGGGLRVRTTQGLLLVAAVDAAFMTPRPVLRFADRAVAKTAQPALLPMLGVELTW